MTWPGGRVSRPYARVLLAPLRALALVLLAVAGLVVATAALLLLGFIVTIPALHSALRRVAEIGRRLGRAWGGVAIRSGYAPLPPPPSPRADGRFEHHNQLYRSARVPAFMMRVEALGKDTTYLRDWLWLAVTPVTGGAVAAVPVVLIGAGTAVLAGLVDMPLAVPAGVALMLAGFSVGPVAVRLWARWSRLLLGPVQESWWRRSGVGAWTGRAVRDLWHTAGLAGLGLAALGALVLHVLASAISWGGLFPVAATLTRPYYDYYRRTAAQWTGIDYPSPYRPPPEPPQPDESGRFRVGRRLYTRRASAERFRRYRQTLRDPATWRDLLWTVVTVPVSLIGLVPAVLFLVGAYGLPFQPVSWLPWGLPAALSGGEWVTPWYMWHGLSLGWPPLAAVPGWVSPFIGAGMAAVGVVLARPVLRLRTAFDRWLLPPTRSTLLAQRVARLTETRADAVDAQAAELRRIERDLHDGAQARLVAVGLGLATVEALIEQDPQTARALLAQARDTSATALRELRDLVRGIHPPVLAERGLAEAIRAVALDSPLPVAVSADLPGRPEPPVESAAYFATVEALANAARHAEASRMAIDIRHAGGVLRIIVTDDGRGGADPARGTGLRGIERRLGTFDGVLAVHSPAGGPTVLTMEIPCALSSPRTSTF